MKIMSGFFISCGMYFTLEYNSRLVRSVLLNAVHDVWFPDLFQSLSWSAGMALLLKRSIVGLRLNVYVELEVKLSFSDLLGPEILVGCFKERSA